MEPDRRRDRKGELVDLVFRADALLGTGWVRVLLSAVILLSVLPIGIVEHLRLVFLLLFGVELSVRTTIFTVRWRLRNERYLSEALFLTLDLLATLSFLPIDMLSFVGADMSVLRLVRAARMLLLLAYWGPYFRDFFQIALGRERLYQFGLVAVFALMLSATGAAALRLFDLRLIDTNGNGIPGEEDDWGLINVLWWSFRQVQDPGNLLQDTHELGVLAVSLALTTGGMLLVAFLIGIGASLVEELFRAGRHRPLALRNHTVILNAGADSLGVLSEISSYYRKQVSRPRMVVMGSSPERPDFMNQPNVRRFRYLPGRPTDLGDLTKAAVGSARRVVLLAAGSGQEADADTVTVALAVRERSEDAMVAAEINHPRNAALMAAARGRTIPVLARRLASLVMGQCIVSPGAELVMGELLSSDGSEIYTCVSGEAACSGTPWCLPLDGHLHDAIMPAYERGRVILLGVLHERTIPSGAARPTTLLVPTLNPGPLRDIPVRGLIGVADSFRSLKQQVELAAKGGLSRATAPAPLADDDPLVRVHIDDYPRNVLVLGFHDDAVETMEQLVRLCEPGLVVRILVGTTSKRRRVVDALIEQLGSVGDLDLQVTAEGPAVRYPSGTTRLVVETQDRLRPGLYTEAIDGEHRPDTMLLLRRDRPELDPDAATVLGMLRLMESAAATLARRPDHDLPHIVAELADPEKLALIRSRLRGHVLGTSCSLVCTESLRQRILAQSFFVPALTELYQELLTAGEQELLTLEPTRPATFRELLARLPREQGLIPIAVAYRSDEQPCGLRVVVNPDPEADDDGVVDRIFAVGGSELRERAQRERAGR